MPEYNPQPILNESEALQDVTRLTTPNGTDAFDRAGAGRLSPDGQWVVFRGVARGDAGATPPIYSLYLSRVRWDAGRDDPDRHVVAVDHPIRITRPGIRCGGASFSPDGFTLLFAATDGPAGPMRLFRADNWAQAVAMTDAARGVDLAQHAVTPATLSADESDWSPDGKSVVFAATAATGGPIGLYVIQPDGSHLLRLGPSSGYARGPSFSPDGREIVYRGDRLGRPTSQVMSADLVFDMNGIVVGLTDEVALTHEAGVVASGPCWFAGDHIVYATTRHGSSNAELYVMDSDGNRKTRLTMTPGPDLLPYVTRDGHHLLWTRAGAPDAPPQLYYADLHLPPGS